MTTLPVEKAVVDELRARVPGYKINIGTDGESAQTSITRVGGGSHPYQPLDLPMLQLSIWGDVNGLTPLLSRLEQITSALRWGNVVRNNLRLSEPTIVSSVFLPDPDNNRPRYAVTISLSALRVAA